MNEQGFHPCYTWIYSNIHDKWDLTNDLEHVKLSFVQNGSFLTRIIVNNRPIDTFYLEQVTWPVRDRCQLNRFFSLKIHMLKITKYSKPKFLQIVKNSSFCFFFNIFSQEHIGKFVVIYMLGSYSDNLVFSHVLRRGYEFFKDLNTFWNVQIAVQ